MLSTGGNRRRRARGSCYVNKPAYGFFIAGSSHKSMNGVYVRDNAPDFDPENKDGKRDSALYYTHEDDDSGWTMSLEKLPEMPEDEESSEDEYGYGYHYREPKKKKEYEWVFIDPDTKSRFSHDGDTIVPGAGVRWSHIHHTTSGTNADATSPETTKDSTATSSQQVVEAEKDDEDELPWQVIALLDNDIMEQLVWASRRRKQRVQRSMAGKSATKIGQFTLEGCFVPGRFLYRVVAKEGIQTYSEASLTSTSHHDNKLEFLSYAVGVELGKGGQWLRLDSNKHTAPSASSSSRSYYGGRGETDRYYDASYGLGSDEVWVQIYTQAGTPLLVRVEQEDMPHIGEIDEDVDDGGLESDRFDKPFVPRVEDDANNGSANGNGEVDLNAIDIDDDDDDFAVASPEVKIEEEEISVVDAVRQEAEESSARSSYPIGTPVVVEGLLGATQQKYNGVSGVIVTHLDVGVGKCTVRMHAPFSGKRLMVHPLNLTVCSGKKLSGTQDDDDSDDDDDDDDDDDESDMDGVDGPSTASTHKKGDLVVRYCRTLGIDPIVLGLASRSGTEEKKSNTEAATEAATESDGDMNIDIDPFLYGFGLSGNEPIVRLQSAIRANIRDAAGDHYGMSAVEEAGTHLLETIQKLEPPSYKDATPQTADDAKTNSSTQHTAMPPHLLVISGVLGPRAAAAASASHSLHDLNAAERGIGALRKLLGHEIRRRSNLFSLTPDDQGQDELRLRCTIVSALLHGNRDATALREASEASRQFPSSASTSFLRARCLFRRAMRSEALTELKRNASMNTSTTSATAISTPDEVWAQGEASRMLRAVQQAETRRIRAVDAYERGKFEDAVAEYTMSITCSETGFREDKRYRATLLSNRAACHRRRGAEGLEEALLDCDSALCLLPKMARYV